MSRKRLPKGPARVYTLETELIGGNVTEEFVTKNPVVSRTIEIRGDQTLDDLHWGIFSAYDREEMHMFEFQFGKEPGHRKNRCYVMPEAEQSTLFGFGSQHAGLVSKTRLDDLGLAVGTTFFYWFDFGDDWWHEIRVKAVSQPQATTEKYPRIVARVGDSPPQYPDLEGEFVDDDADDVDGDDEE